MKNDIEMNIHQASPGKTKLDLMIGIAEKRATELYQKMQVAAKLDRAAELALQRKQVIARSRADSLNALKLKTPGAIAALVKKAQELSARLKEESTPGNCRSLQLQFSKLRRDYNLWCEHHRKDPEKLTLPTRGEKIGHGGGRSGAGRRPKGNVQMLIRLKEETRIAFQSIAEQSGMTPGEWLDANIGRLKGK